MGPRRSVFINRFYDSMPWHLSFGRLQQQLMPLARYFWWNEAEDRWVVMNFDEYKEKYPCRSIFQIGTLDVIASSVEVSWVLPSYEACGARLMLAPQIVERGNASTLHSALEQGSDAMSLPNIRRMAAVCPWLILNEQPDACPSNGRRQAKVIEDCRDMPNVVQARGKCGSHQAQRIVASTVSGSCGDAHAVGVSCSATSHAIKMQESLKTIIESARIFRCAPSNTNVERNEAIVRSTLLRRQEYICQDAGSSSHLGRQDELSAAKKFLKVWNGR